MLICNWVYLDILLTSADIVTIYWHHVQETFKIMSCQSMWFFFLILAHFTLHHLRFRTRAHTLHSLLVINSTFLLIILASTQHSLLKGQLVLVPRAAIYRRDVTYPGRATSEPHQVPVTVSSWPVHSKAMGIQSVLVWKA